MCDIGLKKCENDTPLFDCCRIYRQAGKLRGVLRSGDWLSTDVWRRDETACQVVAHDRAYCLDNRYVALLYRYVLYRGGK
jgi:hypothetical protein